jgi:DNA-binding cell septation regulator SpoVG
MKISNIDIFEVDGPDLKAVVQFTIDDCIRISGVKLYVNHNNAYVVKYPVNAGSKKKLAYIFPLDNETRIAIETQIIKAYENQSIK